MRLSQKLGQQTTALIRTSSARQGNETVRCAGTSVDGSDGTRTRDLRRDRPVLVMPVWAGIGGDYRCQQGFPTVVLRVRRAPAGASGDLLRDQRGMLRCLSGKRSGSARDGGRGSRRGRQPRALCQSLARFAPRSGTPSERSAELNRRGALGCVDRSEGPASAHEASDGFRASACQNGVVPSELRRPVLLYDGD